MFKISERTTPFLSNPLQALRKVQKPSGTESAILNRAIRMVRFQRRRKHGQDAIRMATLNRFSAILLYCDSTRFFASRCGISGDSRPAILGIVRFTICDSVLLSAKVITFSYLFSSGIGKNTPEQKFEK